MITYSDFANFDKDNLLGDKVSKDFIVKVNGENIPVYLCPVSHHPENAWDGVIRDKSQRELASFVNIVGDQNISLEVIAKNNFKRVILKPVSKNIEKVVYENCIKFNIEHGQYVLELDDHHTKLIIFYSPYYKCENKGFDYYFGAGVFDVGTIELKSNQKIYIDKDAFVYGSICGQDAENIEIIGNGIFCQEKVEREATWVWTFKKEEHGAKGNASFLRCKNIKFTGVGFMDSSIWCVSPFDCENIVFDNIKIFGQWRYNTDGIDLCNCRNVLIKDSFIQSFDDALVIKGVDNNKCYMHNNENIAFENCVVWCDWGKSLEIGFETSCQEDKNISYKNIDIIHSTVTAISVHNGDYGEVSNVRYENINVEINDYEQDVLLLQKGATIPDKTGIRFPAVIDINNERFHEIYHIASYPEGSEERALNKASNHDISLKNINVYVDKDVPHVDGKINAVVQLNNYLEKEKFYNIKLENFIVNGKKLNKNEMILYGNAIDVLEIK